ncbi:uncharacterized protein LOC134202427 [Armigeres subalbatus]|uniref:uncharacterized protein LOC134202427 n=1 Tax=Armigeres subalbatus TaxID=124917 RepID=UPI002ED68ADE
MNLRVKDLDEIIEVEELFTALRRKCEVKTPTAAVRLRKGPAGTQSIRLSAADTSKVVKLGSVKVGWSVCPVACTSNPKRVTMFDAARTRSLPRGCVVHCPPFEAFVPKGRWAWRQWKRFSGSGM